MLLDELMFDDICPRFDEVSFVMFNEASTAMLNEVADVTFGETYTFVLRRDQPVLVLDEINQFLCLTRSTILSRV